VLDIAKIESGQFSLNLGEYALESVVETVRGATESLAETKKLAFKTDVARSLPIGLGDEQRLTQVLLNLVGNAIKFTDSGGVLVTVGRSLGAKPPAEKDDIEVAIAVEDTGIGITPEALPSLFSEFEQAENAVRALHGVFLA
jgi:signal transduction histidine kinase